MKKITQPRWFRNISIAKKLYFVVGLMALLIAMELAVLVFSISAISSVRGYVGGEGLWSKAQKDAVHNLQKYIHSGKEKDYQKFLYFLNVPLGDKLARIEMAKENANYNLMWKGFYQGGIHPDDIDGMIKLFRRFHSISYINKALTVWAEGDSIMAEFQKVADDLHSEIMISGVLPNEKKEISLNQIDNFNSRFTVLENKFSNTLGEGSRWLEGLILQILLAIALTVEISGMLLTILTSRNISKGIGQILKASEQFAKGDYTAKAIVYSRDEIGVLADSFNTMTSDLEQHIHRLREADKKIIDSEERFFKIFDNNPIGMTLSEIKSKKITYANSLFYSAFGYTKEEVIGRTSDDLNLMSPEEKQRLIPLILGYLKKEIDGRTLAELQELPPEETEKLIMQLKEKDEMKGFDILYSRKNGQTFSALVSYQVIGIGKDKYTITSYQDITVLKKNEETLKRKTTQLFEAQQLAHIGSWEWDVLSNKIEWSDELYRIYGFSPQEFEPDFERYMKCIHPEDNEYVNNSIQQAFKDQQPFNFSHRIVRPDGAVRVINSRGTVFTDGNGNTTRMAGTAQGVTELKLESQFARSLIEATRDPLVTINADGKITDMNEATVKVTDRTRRELVGSDFKDYFTDPQKALESYQEVFAKGFVTDYPLTIKDGKLTDVLFNGSVYKDEHGTVLGAVVVARDITKQKRIEKELIDAKIVAENARRKAENAVQIAEVAVKSKQTFLANMSHEIRTPMNAIIGFTSVILKSNLDEKQKEYINAIKISGDGLIVLINDILDLAKVDAGKMTFIKAPFKLSESISAMLHVFETKIQEKNIELIKQYDPLIPEVLLGDSARLHQVILNLLSNAVKFTAEGKVIINVRLLKQDDKEVTIEFSVSDSGIGIPEDRLEEIFSAFQQATNETTSLFGGTGLGLAIVKQLIESQDGTISVKSKLGKGSTFTFDLTFEKTDAEVEKEEVIKTGLETAVKNLRVLVVEDIKLNQLLMKTVFTGFGIKIVIADNGKIAIEKLKKNNFDIVFMDLQMPEMNGFDATEYIRTKMNSKVPIIALTADVTAMDVERCRIVGMDDYISKPIDEKLLYNKIIKYSENPFSKSS